MQKIHKYTCIWGHGVLQVVIVALLCLHTALIFGVSISPTLTLWHLELINLSKCNSSEHIIQQDSAHEARYLLIVRLS